MVGDSRETYCAAVVPRLTNWLKRHHTSTTSQAGSVNEILTSRTAADGMSCGKV